MKPDDYAKLEKDYSFKRSYLNNTPWWKNLAMLPPVLLLFAGLIGILYLFRNDMLASLYIIPYIVLFVLGTIFLKTTKGYIQKQKINKEGAFRVCLAKPFWEKSGHVYVAFVTDSHRYNKHYINNLVKNISLDSIIEKYSPSMKRQSHLVHDEESNMDFYIRIYDDKDITKRNATWRDEYLFPVLYIDDQYTYIIKKKDLSYYGK
ncbi:MAG: hypothetical protein LBV43_01385 [Prevotella sp.]|jgi:hypothetical protein|nr:hypothetical protein [Prevotella sp.]